MKYNVLYSSHLKAIPFGFVRGCLIWNPPRALRYVNPQWEGPGSSIEGPVTEPLCKWSFAVLLSAWKSDYCITGKLYPGISLNKSPRKDMFFLS